MHYINKLRAKITTLVFGTDDRNFREIFFMGFCALFSLFSVISLVINQLIGIDSMINVLCIIAAITYFIGYYLFRFKKIKFYPQIPLITYITSLLFLSITWFANGGLIGTIPSVLLVTSFCFIAFLDHKYWTFVTVTLIAGFLLLTYLEQQFPNWLYVYPSNHIHIYDLLICNVIGIFIITALTKKMIRLQFKEKETVQIQNQALRASEEKLKKAIEAANQASLAKADFLSVMSHELRTPMNAVIGMTHLLMQENPNSEQLERLRILQFSADQLMVLINDILDFNKIDAGKIEFEETNFDLKELLHQIHQTLLSLADDKGLQFNINIDGEIANKLIGDPNRLAQVINNLVSNAIKFTTKGSIAIKATLVDYTPEESHILFEVIDTGIGIPKDKIENIFDNFTQASSSTTRQFGGTGLGLTITKKLLALQGSTIKVESEVGQGSNFSFQLAFKNSNFVEQAPSRAEVKPMLKMSKVRIQKDINTPSQPTIPSLSGMHILVVEDHKVNQIVVGNFLKKWETTFDLAEDGKQAVDMAKTKQYDLILMDLQLPVMDGYEATKIIREQDDTYLQKVPIVALTASAIVEINERALKVGMNDFVTKPFKPDELNKVLLKFVSQDEQEEMENP